MPIALGVTYANRALSQSILWRHRRGRARRHGLGNSRRRGRSRQIIGIVARDGARVALTFVCGDNYAVEHQDELTAAVLEKLREVNVDLFVAGPCFDAGRYGMAAGALCRAVQAELGIPVVTAMSEENPGVDLYRDALYIIDSGTNVTKLRDVVAKMAALGKKLSANEPIGSPAEEGYLRRGWLRDQLVEKKAATRLVDMLLAKMKGEPFESEMPATSFAPVPMPAAIRDLSKAKVMLITDGGLVPKGNPDRIEGTAATRWGSYNIEGTRRFARRRLRSFPRRLRHPIRPGRSRPAGAPRRHARDGEKRRHRQAARRIHLHLRPIQSVVEHAPPRPRDGGKDQTGTASTAVILTST